jgi:fructose-1,6-bisphosphatase/inositol monophosphatase family enzyme
VTIKSSDKRFLEQYQKSPVTLADKEAERAIKEYVGFFYPDHGFIGEEEGEEQVNSDFKWIIDPIDGTRNFAR